MVDCRGSGAAGPAPAHELHAHHAPHAHAHNGAPAPAPPPDHPGQAGANVGGEMSGAHGGPSPAPAPAPPNTLTSYAGGMNSGSYMNAPYVCGMGGMKSVVWMGAPPAPPPPVNPHVYKSVQPNGADLPMNDIPTLRYYFNLGVDCMWASYGPPPHMQPQHHHPPRHYSPRDLAQDMQQISLHERPNTNHAMGEGHMKHKLAPLGDKPLNNQNKGNGPRPLLGPRFKRGNHQEGNQNNHNQNKGHNNMPNKGPGNNRRNSHGEPARAFEECPLEPPVLTLPYIPYPPPIYPISYYPVDSDPGMMGMMGGMGYVGFEEGAEFGAPLPYYHAHHYPPPPHDHK